MKASLFDDRRNSLGEGPTSSGPKNEMVMWVDIDGQKVRSRHLITGEISEYDTDERVGFAIPRKSGGEILGTANGPILRDADGTIHVLPTRIDADGYKASQIVRWNDAKVSPTGDLFLGTLAYDYKTNAGAFYQMRGDGKHMRRLFGDVSISNGVDWTVDGSIMYYIDTPLRRMDVFDVEEREIKNRRTLVNFPDGIGNPDGMSVDADDNLWVAFWLGHAVRCYNGKTGELLEEIQVPALRVTSCVFAGENLDQLIITSAGQDTDLKEWPEAGMTHIATPGVRGQKTALFGA
jgi:sugar lactone lactonase YvrE